MTTIAKLGPRRKLPHAIWAWKLFAQEHRADIPQAPLYSFWHPHSRTDLACAPDLGTYRRYTPGRPSLEDPKGFGFFCYHSYTDYVLQHYGPYNHQWIRKRRTRTMEEQAQLWLIAIPQGTPIRTGFDRDMNRSVLLAHALVPLVPLRGLVSLNSVTKWTEDHWRKAEGQLPSYSELTRKQEASRCAR